MPAIEEFSIAAKEAEGWIDDLTSRLGWHDRGKVYRALLASLHALRDALGRDEAVYLGAQLPPLLRGFYYEGWHPETHTIVRGRSVFLERVHDGVHREPGIDAEEVARAVFAFLASRLPAAELENAKAATPNRCCLFAAYKITRAPCGNRNVSR